MEIKLDQIETKPRNSNPDPSVGRRPCAECGDLFHAVRHMQQFCSPQCKRVFHERAVLEGRAIVALVKAWRGSRNRREDGPLGSQCLSEICSIVDGFNAADREAGRPAPQLYAKRALAAGRYVDRARRK